MRPDGTTGESRWIVECDACFKRRNLSDRFEIKGDVVWKGDDPIIEVAPLTGLRQGL